MEVWTELLWLPTYHHLLWGLCSWQRRPLVWAEEEQNPEFCKGVCLQPLLQWSHSLCWRWRPTWQSNALPKEDHISSGLNSFFWRTYQWAIYMNLSMINLSHTNLHTVTMSTVPPDCTQEHLKTRDWAERALTSPSLQLGFPLLHSWLLYACFWFSLCSVSQESWTYRWF